MARTVALVGNPNSGKTTLFNALTGANQYVGNWPGVTVEKKEGRLKGDRDVRVVDLPGIYSLSPYTLEEVVARNYLVEEAPDALLNIVDGSNLERNLNLTLQLLEMGIPVLVAVNMMDVVAKRGDTVNAEQLSADLGCPVVEISALKGDGVDIVAKRLAELAEAQVPAHAPKCFPDDVEEALGVIEERLAAQGVTYTAKSTGKGKAADKAAGAAAAAATPAPANSAAAAGAAAAHARRFIAVKLFERDDKINDLLPAAPKVDDVIAPIERTYDDDSQSIIINERYAHISRIIDRSYSQKHAGQRSISDRIDGVVTNRILALPIFVVIMFLVYFISVTTVGTIATDWANDGVFGDGWFLTGEPEAYSEVAGEWDDAQTAVETFVAAGEAAGLDPESANFVSAAERANVTGSYDAYDDESGVNEIVIVDAAAYEEALEVEEPDPAAYGIWVPGIPALLGGALEAGNVAEWLSSLILDGIVAGVGAVLGFVPQMLILFFLLALLELSGYMARIAFILDRVFRRFGLSGKSFIPILIGTGCGVPGIMASRTIENQADRRMTIMTTTFIPCGAKLPIIALFAGAIFGGAWWVAGSAYFLGIAAILCSGIILKKTRFFAGDAAPFIMELPAYHRPTLGAVLRVMWERGWSFIKRAGSIILIATIVVWFISSYGIVDGVFGAVENSDESLLAAVGGAISFIFAPLGFGNWQATSATITGLIAKENLVGTFGILYAGDAGWYTNLQIAFTPLAAYSILAFNLLCAPCFAAMGAIKREMNNLKWFFAAIGYQCGLAWIVALWVYQIGGLVSGTVPFGIFTVIALLFAAAFFFLLFRPARRNQSKALTPQTSTEG